METVNICKAGARCLFLLGFAVRASRQGFNCNHVLLLLKMLLGWGTENDVSFYLYLTVRNIPHAA